ncbi:MAG: four helix bundle protein, partial [Bacteroidia bacterium]|nr:four helix bundle protein [Bacteroidia bacterium]
SKIDRFEDLDCWKKSRELVNLIFDICENQMKNKDFSTQDQIKRAALSTMNNIAEGFGRYSNKEFIRFLEYSAASSMEIRSMLYILSDRKYIDEIEFEKCYQLTNDLTNTTLGLIRYLKTKI